MRGSSRIGALKGYPLMSWPSDFSHVLGIELARALSSHAFTTCLAANHPRLPGIWNMGIGKRPVCRALLSASLEGKPIARAASAALKMGADGKKRSTSETC